jgi:hypothetical protein
MAFAGALAPARTGWLVDRRHDLISTVGGAAASLALVGSTSGWWTGVVALEGPRLLATVSRTSLDAREWQPWRRLLLGSLGWFTAGPLLFGMSALLETTVPFGVFLTAACPPAKPATGT